MEPERSLTRLQQPVAYPRAHPDESSPRKCTSNPTVAALHHQTLMHIAKHCTDDVYVPVTRHTTAAASTSGLGLLHLSLHTSKTRLH